jgi:hypothetical protein
MRDEMNKGQRIAILLRHPQRLTDACHCGQTLLECGAAVSFFCLCREFDPAVQWDIQSLLATRVPCFTDNSDLAARYDLAHLSLRSLVRRIESSDWVIPI